MEDKYYRFYKLTKNSLKCLACNDVIVSAHRHDFVWCKCGAVAVDGGNEYSRRVGDFYNTEDLNEYTKKTVEEIQWYLDSDYTTDDVKLLAKEALKEWYNV